MYAKANPFVCHISSIRSSTNVFINSIPRKHAAPKDFVCSVCVFISEVVTVLNVHQIFVADSILIEDLV